MAGFSPVQVRRWCSKPSARAHPQTVSAPLVSQIADHGRPWLRRCHVRRAQTSSHRAASAPPNPDRPRPQAASVYAASRSRARSSVKRRAPRAASALQFLAFALRRVADARRRAWIFDADLVEGGAGLFLGAHGAGTGPAAARRPGPAPTGRIWWKSRDIFPPLPDAFRAGKSSSDVERRRRGEFALRILWPERLAATFPPPRTYRPSAWRPLRHTPPSARAGPLPGREQSRGRASDCRRRGGHGRCRAAGRLHAPAQRW